MLIGGAVRKFIGRQAHNRAVICRNMAACVKICPQQSSGESCDRKHAGARPASKWAARPSRTESRHGGAGQQLAKRLSGAAEDPQLLWFNGSNT